MDNKKFRSGLIIGTLTATFAIADKLITNNYHTPAEVIRVCAIGLFYGIVCGLAAVLFTRKKKAAAADGKIYVASGETLLFQTAAVYFKGMRAIGGKLYLTDKRLVFSANKSTPENALVTIKVRDINDFKRYKILGLVNHGLSVSTNTNTAEKFEVAEAEKWVKQLSERKTTDPS